MSRAAPLRRRARLIEAEPLASGVRRLCFAMAADQEPWTYLAGQWINLYLPEDSTQPRSYSLANAPGQLPDGRWEIAVGEIDDGRISPQLQQLPLGAEVELDGPWGVFTFRPPEPEQTNLFIATGTGVVPLRAMLQQAQLAFSGAAHRLLFGCRSQADILWGNEFRAWQRRSDRFRYEVTLSRPDEPWQGRRGYVQEHLGELMRETSKPMVYVCGRGAMVEDVRHRLKHEFGLDRRAIRTERFD